MAVTKCMLEYASVKLQAIAMNGVTKSVLSKV